MTKPEDLARSGYRVRSNSSAIRPKTRAILAALEARGVELWRMNTGWATLINGHARHFATLKQITECLSLPYS